MINYTEKGNGLNEAIARAGYSLKQLNGVYVTSETPGDTSKDAAVQAIIDGYTLADAKAAVGDCIDAEAKRIRAKFLKAVDPSEMAAWATKYAEAKALLAGGPAIDAVNLQAEADFRGITLNQLATKVVQKFNQTANREAKIAGLAGKHKDAVTALGSFAAVNSYDWQTPLAGA